MSKVISIRENGEQKQFSTNKIKTLMQDGTYALWVPEDEIDVIERVITENGVYSAEDEGHYGYSQVTVNVQGETGGGVLHGTSVPTNDLGENGYVYLLETPTIETPSWMSTLGYTKIEYLEVGEAGPYINLGSLDVDTNLMRSFGVDMVFLQIPSENMGIFGVTGTESNNMSISFNGTVSRDHMERSTDSTDFAYGVTEGYTESVTVGSTQFSQSTVDGVLRNYAGTGGSTLGSEDKYLFATNGIANKASHLRVYGLQVQCSLNSVDISHLFYPARHSTNGTLGFIDSYDHTFYPNAGTGSFTGGGTGGEIIGVYYKQNGTWTELFPDARGHYFGNGSGSSSGGSTSGSGSSESGSSETGNTSGSGSSESGTGSGSESGSSGTEESGQEAVTVDEILVYKDGTKYENLSYQNWPNESNTDRIFEDNDKLRFLIDSTSADAETGDYYRLWVWSTEKYDISNYTSAYIKYALNGTVYETTLDISSLRGSKNIAVHFWYKLAYDYEVDGVAYHNPEECSATFYIHEEDYTEAQSVETKLFDREDNSPSTFYIYEMRIDP